MLEDNTHFEVERSFTRLNRSPPKNKMDNIKKEPEFQKFLDFNNDMTLLVVPIQHPQAWQSLVMSGWRIINVDNKNNQVTLVRGFCNA